MTGRNVQGSRALVVAPSTVGDAVMAQPLLALLRQQDPGLRIDALCNAQVATVFRAMAEIGDVIEAIAPEDRAQLAARWRLGRSLRARRYRFAYVLPESRVAALVPWFAGVAQRVGYRGEARHLLLNQIHESDDEHPVRQAERYARLAFERGTRLPGSVRDPRLVRQPERERAVRIRFGLGRGSAPIVLCPGSGGGGSHRWPSRHFASLINLLAHEWPQYEVLLVGPPTERQVATEIAALSGRAVRNLCGETTLEEAAALVSQAGGVVSGDTGLMHLAAAFGRPQVAVFGPSDPRNAPPRSSRANVEWLHASCSPCSAPECPLAHHACMNRIEAAQVFASLGRAMRFETSGARSSR